jgi:hypothetical protein
LIPLTSPFPFQVPTSRLLPGWAVLCYGVAADVEEALTMYIVKTWVLPGWAVLCYGVAADVEDV